MQESKTDKSLNLLEENVILRNNVKELQEQLQNAYNRIIEWVWNDLENLKEYGLAVYPDAVAVKSIMCVHKGSEI